MPLSPIGPSPPAFIVLVAPALPSRRNQIHPQISIHLPISSRFTNGTQQPENIEIASVHNPCLCANLHKIQRLFRNLVPGMLQQNTLNSFSSCPQLKP